MKSVLIAAIFGLLALPCAGQSILPQIVDGGNWRTAIVLVNTTTSVANPSLNFYQDAGGDQTQPWNPPFLEVSSTQNLSIPPAGTLYLHTPGTASQLAQGWAQVSGSAAVQAYAIYTYESFNGRPDQDGTSQAASPSTRILVPFDNTPGYATGIAVVNPNSTPELISVNIQIDTGATFNAALTTLPANGQAAFEAVQQFPQTIGHRGLLEFIASSGTIAIASFRFNPTLALTSSPVFPQTGPPIIGNTGGSSAFSTFSAIGSFSPNGSSSTAIAISITPNQDGSYQATYSAGIGTASLQGSAQATTSNNGQTFTFNVLSQSTSISSASLTITLTEAEQSDLSATGSFAGTLTEQFTSAFGGAVSTGAISGTYSETFAQ